MNFHTQLEVASIENKCIFQLTSLDEGEDLMIAT